MPDCVTPEAVPALECPPVSGLLIPKVSMRYFNMRRLMPSMVAACVWTYVVQLERIQNDFALNSITAFSSDMRPASVSSRSELERVSVRGYWEDVRA